MTTIPREFIELVLARTDIVDLIHAQIPLRKKSNNNYFACCPFHKEKSASFSVSQHKQFYYCFGCGAHGNALDFLIEHNHLNFLEAIESLASQANLAIPQEVNSPNKQTALPELYALNEKVAQYYYEKLRNTKRAIEYLKNRGVSGATAKTFSLGYAENHWHALYDHFCTNPTATQQCLQIGLIIKKNADNFYDRFRDRIIFPIHDRRGRIIGFGGRIIDHGEPKYLNSPDTPLFQKGHELYGLYQALKANRTLERVMLVEGYMDVIALFQHNITFAVATLGTATTTQHLTQLMRYTSEIIFSFDGDTAGRNAARRALQIALPLMDDQINIRFLFLPQGEDPDSLIRKEGKEKFMGRIHAAQPLSHFFFDVLALQCDMETMEGRARLAHLALAQINPLPQTLFKKLLLDELSRRARIAPAELSKQIKRVAAPQQAATPALQIKPTATQFSAPMRVALSLIIKHPDLTNLLPADFVLLHVPGRLFLLELVDIIQKKPNIATGTLFEYFRGREEADMLAELIRQEHALPAEKLQSEFLGAIQKLLALDQENVIETLLAKAAHKGLTDAEKIILTNKIHDKKLLINKQS